MESFIKHFFLDQILLKCSLTFLAVFFCMIIIVGDVLVVKPPIIFGDVPSGKPVDVSEQIFIYISLLVRKSEGGTSEHDISNMLEWHFVFTQHLVVQ